MRQDLGAGAPAIDVRNLTKQFRRDDARRGKSKFKRALNDVSMVIGRREMAAVVGINGSGKSTLIRILATLTLPDAGTARIFGLDVVTDAAEVRRRINRVSVEASFFKAMSAWENLSYATRLYGAGGRRSRDAAINALRRLGLPRDAVDRPMKSLSRGQQQKVAIARSLLTSPSLLLLDEPTTGLDPRSKREVQAFLSEVHSEGDTTVVISTHDMAEVEALCRRVVVLDRGRVIADDTPEALRRNGGGGDGDTSLEDTFLRLTGRRPDETDEEDETREDVA